MTSRFPFFITSAYASTSRLFNTSTFIKSISTTTAPFVHKPCISKFPYGRRRQSSLPFASPSPPPTPNSIPRPTMTATEESTKAPTTSEEPRSFRLAPSDFAFLWNECKRCFYFKVHGLMYRPRAPFPSIFGNIDLAMKRHFRGLRTTDIIPNMPPGTFLCEDEDAWVESKLITPENHKDSVYIRGMIDCLVQFDDGTYGIVDFKTSAASSKSSSTYTHQLHAYAKAIENPSINSQLEQCNISDLSLVIYTPNSFHTPIDDNQKISASLNGSLTYNPVQRNDRVFEEFLSSMLDVLVLPNAPDPPKAKNNRYTKANRYSSCPYCQYLHESKMKNF